MEEKRSDKTYGAIGTTVFHVVLLLLLLIFGLKSIPQEEEGILVALGDGPTGMGPAVPSRSAPVTQQQQSATPPPRPRTPPPASTPPPSQEQLLTQKTEEAPAISAEEKARRAAEQKRLEEERRRQTELDRQRREAEAEAERLRQAELERQRQEAEAERQRLAEEQRKREEQERQAAEARNAVSGAFSNQGSTAQSSGEAGGAGSQGALTGDPNARTYTGTGLGASGNSFSLSGRSLSGTLPRPAYNIQEEGIVVVEITVDRTGVVTSAQPILRGTTTQNSTLWEEARKAALKARFNPDQGAPALQKGIITYHFVLN